MNMPLSGNHTLLKLKFTLGTDELHAGGAGNVATLAHRRGYAERACVGQRDLNLRRAPYRPENRYVAKGVFRADHIDLFLACKLAGLGQHFFHRQLMSLAEQRFNLLGGEMHMSG